jgi:type IV pilus assembly protein PilY1
MRQTSTRKTAAISTAAALIVSLPPFLSQAALTDISNMPMYSANVTTVKPNLLLTVDTSGSMGWDFMPDNASPDGSSDFGETSSTAYNCLYQGAGNNQGNNNCSPGDPPYYANQYNFVTYNPTFTYTAGVNYDGSSKGNITNFGSVPNDAYNSGAGTISFTGNSFPEQAYANSQGFIKRNGERYPQGNLPPVQSGVTVTAFSYATPAKPQLTGVSVSGFGSGATVTGTIGSGTTPAVGDVIDVVCTTGSGATTPFVLANAVPVITSSGSTFTFTTGQNFGTVSCTKATVNYSVVGYPEQADSSGYALNSSNGSWNYNWAITVPGVAAGVKNSGGTVTVNFYNHGLVVGDYITVSGGGSNCNISNTKVTAVTLGTGVYAAVPVSFQYKVASGSACSGTYTFKRQAYDAQINGASTPFYYTITPIEYCSDQHLTTCTVPGAGGAAPPGYPNKAYVRYCNTQTGANSAAAAPAVTGPAASPTAPYCQNKYLFGAGYKYPRYGMFTRTDILTGNTYPNYAGRTDCGTGPTCTYTQEMTNFSNWYAYYRTRLQMMKTLLGQALVNLSSSYRVGFIIINPDGNNGNPISSTNKVQSSSYVPVNDFTSAQKQTLYNTFYSQNANHSTPLRSALARAGRYFGGKHDYINSGMNDDPVQYSCQQNFVLLTTDGYWNTNANGDQEAVGLDGHTVVGDQDNSAAFKAAGDGTYEGDLGVDYSVSPPKILSSCQAGTYAKGGCANTLADVAAYYYNTDLRPTGSTNLAGTDVSQDNVPFTPNDPAYWQHMTTFTLGLADGLMTWQNNYAGSTSGDFYSITTGQTGCWWLPVNGSSTSFCQWPVPLHDSPTALDDLWHAAVNGHGVYYHGTNPRSVASGITSALSEINVRLASAAAAATSSPQITQTNNFIYSSTYDTVQWSGDIVANTIDPSTGLVSTKPVWDAADTLDTQVGASSDSRTIYTYDTVNKILKPFTWASLTATEQTSFTNLCLLATPLTQCPALTPAQLVQSNDGFDVLNYIRGQRGNEGVETGAGVFRTRAHVLGDTVDAQPAYVGPPPYSFTDAVTPSYASFQALNASRQPVLYVGANDGMLHAFNANAGAGSTGNELWAYVPRMLFSKLYMLADSNYANLHQFYVDGTPATMDAYYAGAWHTVLVGGLNSGGRGYYALDITNPTSPKALWEFCSDSTVCGTNSDADMGSTYGTPIITKRASDGKWVVLVTSGYNNVSPGSGQEWLYVLDLQTGAMLQKLGTGAGSTTTPGGLARFAAWADNPLQDNTTKYVYAGDLLGNVWRFDLTASPASPNPLKLGMLTDSSGKAQPVTTRPELATVQGSRVLYIGTGEFLGNSDVSNTGTQSLYAFKDLGINYGNIRTNAQLIQQTLSNSSNTFRTTTSTNTVNWSTNNGWYVDFPSAGERMNVDPQLVLGTLLVATNIPGASACTTGGTSWFYEFDYSSGRYVATSPSGQVGFGNANALTVGFVIIQLPSGQVGSQNKDSTGKDKYSPVYTGAMPLSGKRQGWRQL